MKKQTKKKSTPVSGVGLPTKSSFFKSRREYEALPKSDNSSIELRQQEASGALFTRSRLLYEAGTDLPYAKVMGDVAYCLETGNELFRFKRREEEDEAQGDFPGRRFDFTPPGGKRHPDDQSVDVLGLVNAGLMSNEDIANARAFSADELKELMAKLEEYRARCEAECALHP